MPEIDASRRWGAAIAADRSSLSVSFRASQLLSNPGSRTEDLCENYLEHNATRNRALDMLPIFAEVDERRIEEQVGDSKVNPRLTFHYRLPNCNIEQEDWSLARPWNKWCLVEELAYRKNDLNKLSSEFLEADRPLVGVSRKSWVEHIDKWARNQGLV